MVGTDPDRRRAHMGVPGARSKNGRSHAIPLPPLAVEILTGMDRIENSSRVFASFSAAHAKTRLDEVMLEVAREDATARGMIQMLLWLRHGVCTI